MEGEFIKKYTNNNKVTLKPFFHKNHFIEWFQTTALSLATSLKIFEILYKKGTFKHLGKPFLVNFKKMPELISELMDALEYMRIGTDLDKLKINGTNG